MGHLAREVAIVARNDGHGGFQRVPQPLIRGLVFDIDRSLCKNWSTDVANFERTFPAHLRKAGFSAVPLNLSDPMIVIFYILFGVKLNRLHMDKGLHEGLVTNTKGLAYMYTVHQKLGSKKEQDLTKWLVHSSRPLT
jgi:hypothetical protein